MKKHKILEVFFEFLIFGVIMGVAEDLLAIVLSTDAPITWSVIWIVIGVTIPFAALGELIVDRKGPFKKLSKWLVRK
ncbi:hypothetical protein HOD61_00600 [archaeon]|nr:hypothetical protein [archaeon]